MYTADMAEQEDQDDLDERIKYAVRNRDSERSASLRIYCEDSWRWSIEAELERRGFKNIQVPDFVLKGDVYFEW